VSANVVFGGHGIGTGARDQGTEDQPRGVVTVHTARSACIHRRRRQRRLQTVLPHHVSIVAYMLSSRT